MNVYDELVENLRSGKITFNMLQMAYRESIRRRDDIPEEVKDLLCGAGEGRAGIIQKMMSNVNEVVGNVELAFRRGSHED